MALDEKAANLELLLVVVVTLAVVGARCLEIVGVADRLAGALGESADYGTAIRGMFFDASPAPLLGLTSAWVYGGAWLGLVAVVVVVVRARK